ncbi:MAG: DUF4446 family protein [Clostridiales bacterium]|jgi:hypothetical protein|nr:DUF4446 family protein [Clostridiales bacterium]
MPLNQIYEAYPYIFWAAGGAFILLLALSACALAKVSSLKRRVDAFMRTESGGDIEKMLRDYISLSERIDGKYDEITRKARDMDKRLTYCLSKVGLVRYNHFQDVGGDLCFALALLDENRAGIVLNTIFSREGSYVYSKPVEDGGSVYPLSEEEKRAILKALEG